MRIGKEMLFRSGMGVMLSLQLMNILYSLDTVLLKVVSIRWEKTGELNVGSLALFFIAVLVLGIYAVLWQMILRKTDLTVAYMCKGMIIFWGMLWATLFFGEQITRGNILGTMLIFGGTYMVTVHE